LEPPVIGFVPCGCGVVMCPARLCFCLCCI